MPDLPGWMQVVIRVRPPLARELQGYRPFENSALVDPNQRVITLSENLQSLTANGNAAQSPDNGMVRLPATSLVQQVLRHI